MYKKIKRIDKYFIKDFYTDAAGVQLHSVFRPLSPQVALTAFYQKAFTNNFDYPDTMMQAPVRLESKTGDIQHRHMRIHRHLGDL